jgi:hypothetical protein
MMLQVGNKRAAVEMNPAAYSYGGDKAMETGILVRFGVSFRPF